MSANIITNILDYKQNGLKIKSSICLDWLQVYGVIKYDFDNLILLEAKAKKELIKINDVLILEHTGMQTKNYLHLFKIYYLGEEFGSLCYLPNETGKKLHLKDFASSIKVNNFFLYRMDWLVILQDIFEILKFDLISVSRMDIAIDNTLSHTFLNDYFFSYKGHIEKLGKSPLKHQKGGLTGRNYDQKTQKFQSFICGSNGSDKYITVYNKTSEIENNSNKKYILDFWKENNIESKNDIYRTEMRLGSKAINNIKDFHFFYLDNPQYLASIFKTLAKNFFEFSLVDDKNTSRRTKIEFICYDNLGGKLLEKTKKEPPTDIYKVKLTIHLLSKLICQNRINEAYQEEAQQFISLFRQRFDLDKWYLNKIDYWRTEYEKIHFLKN